MVIDNIPQHKSGPQSFPSSLDTDADKSVGLPVGMRVGHGHRQDTAWKQATGQSGLLLEHMMERYRAKKKMCAGTFGSLMQTHK